MTDLINHRRTPILDGRLSAAMELAGETKVFADIGADHGRLSAVLLLNDSERMALVADISAPALSKARTLIERLGLTERAVFAVANGLDALDACREHNPDTIFVLGMGGETVSGILRRGQNKLQGARLILGAQTDLPAVRSTLVEIGYRIRHEVVACENERDYILICAEVSQEHEACYSEEELLLGPSLMRQLPQNWSPVLIRRMRLLEQGIHAMTSSANAKDSERLALFQRELKYIQNVLAQLSSGKDE